MYTSVKDIRLINNQTLAERRERYQYNKGNEYINLDEIFTTGIHYNT